MAGRTAAGAAISGARSPAISSRAATVRPLDGRRQAFVMKSVIKNKPLRKGEGAESKAGSIVPEAV
jgi:hypothetical protein